MPAARVRYSIVLLALAVNMLCYTDRVAIAIAAPAIRDEFHFTQSQTGLVLSVFSLSYALGQAPWGALADRYGTRVIVAAAILAWSGFTALTGAAWGFAALLAIRFVFGAFEAALSPSIAAGFARWIPVTERSSAFGAYLGGGRLGGAITPPIAAALMLAIGWRTMFAVFGAGGILAAVVWYVWYRDDPAKHHRMKEAELREIRDGIPPPPTTAHRTDWGAILRSPRLWRLTGVAFCSTFLWQFFITWFPTYLKDRRGMTLQEAAWFAALPFAFGVAATWVGGFATDLLTRRLGPRRGRTWLGCISLSTAAALMLAGILAPAPALAATMMALAAFAVDLYLGAAWASALDIGGRSGGAAAGLMNAASNAAGFVSPALMGFVLDQWKDWNSVLLFGVATTALGCVLWIGVNPREETSTAAV